MQAATVSFPLLMAYSTTGEARSTSHVVMTMSAPLLTSFAAHAFAIAGLLPCVLQVSILILYLPALLTCLIFSCAVTSAGPSYAAIGPIPSYAQPIVTAVALCDAAEPP